MYDQEPFSYIAKTISELSETPLDIDNIHEAISYFAKRYIHLTYNENNPNPTQVQLLERPPQATITNLIDRINRVSGGDKVKILEALQPYPWWFEYVTQNLDSAEFSSKGAFIERRNRKDYQPPLSYAEWLVKRDRIEKRSWIVGIEEIFPQDVGRPPASGVKRSNRRYRILKAAEIIREKRK